MDRVREKIGQRIRVIEDTSRKIVVIGNRNAIITSDEQKESLFLWWESGSENGTEARQNMLNTTNEFFRGRISFVSSINL